VNLTLAWWWMLLALPLVLLPLALPAAKQAGGAVYVPFRAAAPATGSRRHWPARLCFAFAWALLVLATARPQLTSEEIIDNRFVRNLVLAIDISESMLQEDMLVGGRPASRLASLKVALAEFIHKRRGDQLGLVVFADKAFVQSPLSYDANAITSLVEELVVGLAGKRTSIGDALVLAVKVIENNPDANKENASIILLSDGENTWGRVNPADAMRLAAERGIRVHTIGFGGNRLGNAVDERTLRAIAQQTGGSFFRATNTSELRKVYAAIDRLNRVEIDTHAYIKRKEIYHWALLASLVAAIMALFFHTGLGIHAHSTTTDKNS